VTASAPLHDTRSGLRSRPSTRSAPIIIDDPESILRKARRSQKGRETIKARDRPESPTRSQLPGIVKSIETTLADEDRRVDDSAPGLSPDEDTSRLSQDTDPEQTFYRKWGYLAPFDEEAAAVIDAIIADPDMAQTVKRISPENAKFLQGLKYRNVFLTESSAPDPYAGHIKSLAPEDTVLESDAETESHGQLWILDQAKCNLGSNEALFQRTLMMSLIARHWFIYEREATNQRCLDFSVEEPWSCPPMPTRAYWLGTTYLTQPKPDLAVCFRRQALIPDYLWNKLPIATKRLACYENAGEIAETRVFHFFTIEAKKALKSADDNVGKRQGLNNASQALHNMFEFFRDAGQQHENIFFTKVRFFSVVASTEGLTIRIHRATREPEDGLDQGFIIPEYPLRFEYRELYRFQKDNFDRKTVLKTFEQILIGYGVSELRHLLHDAAKALMKKLENDLDGMRAREKDEFYRYGQTSIAPGSRLYTPAASVDRSMQNDTSSHIQQSGMAMEALSQAPSETNISINMLQSGTATPMQTRNQTSTQALNKSEKRGREQSVDSVSARITRQRNQ